MYLFYIQQDFRKEVENQQPQKVKIVTLGHQLLRIRPGDCEAMNERLKQIEEDWERLTCDLPISELQLHSTQMEQMPSRQALNEMLVWLESVRSMLSEEERQPINNQMDLQVTLQKYRVRIVS